MNPAMDFIKVGVCFENFPEAVMALEVIFGIDPSPLQNLPRLAQPPKSSIHCD